MLDRYPQLKIVSVENDIGWIAHFLQRMDHAFEKCDSESAQLLFRRQVHATFQDDRVGVVTRAFVGVGSLMWASDFQHSDSTWPNSCEVIARDFEGVSDNEIRMMVADNAAALYGLG